MVGAPGSGKSTWIKDNKLEGYTVAPDTLRLLLSAPEYQLDGKTGISQKNDRKVWDMLDEILDKRMSIGDFTVVDATHTREKYLKRYKALSEKYRYRLFVKRFDVPLEELLERNNTRGDHKKVPEDVIRLHVERLQHLEISKAFNQLGDDLPAQLNEFIRYEKMDKPVYFIGDIHGTYDPLNKFLTEHFSEKAHFVFLGDYIDRGVQNAETVNALMLLSKEKNVTLLEGNHERWLWFWANDELDNIRSHTFMLHTKKQLDGAVDKKEARMFYRRIRTFTSFEIGGRKVFASHGGVSNPYPNFISSEQLINGCGDYERLPEVYENWKHPETLVHGHRNIQLYPVKVAENIYNVDGDVEKGGALRVVKFNLDGTSEVFEYKNENYVPMPEIEAIGENKSQFDAGLSVEGIVAIAQLRANRNVRESKMGDISAFNFTREAFDRRRWNKTTIKARGLFVNTVTNEVVARSYDKFFNLNEVEATSEFELSKTLKFPVNVYQKYNGFLGIVGYDPSTETVLYTSKATILGMHAEMNKEVLQNAGVEEEKLLPTLKQGYSFIFEIIEPQKDPHIIQYEAPEAVLLDVVKNGFKYEKKPDEETRVLAAAIGVKSKEKITTINEFHELSTFMRKFIAETLTEGAVIEDQAGYMFKLKGDYYKKWKKLRALKDRVHGDSFRMSDFAFDEESMKFLHWCKAKPFEDVKAKDVVALRAEFLKSIQ